MIDLVYEKFSSKELELDIVAYALFKDPVVLRSLKTEWFGYKVLSDIVRVAMSIGSSITKNTVIHSLDLPDTVSPEIYEITWSELTNIDVSGLDSKWFGAMLDKLRELYGSRELLSALNTIMVAVKQGSFSLGKATEMLVPCLRPKATVNDIMQCVDGVDNIIKIVESRKKMNDAGISGIPTGIHLFDSVTGGLYKPEFGVLVGRSGVGKTMGLIHFAISAWKAGYNVLYVSGEMPKVDVEMRIHSYLARLDSMKFRQGTLSVQEIEKLKAVWDQLMIDYDAILAVESFPRNFTVNDIGDVVQNAEDKFGKKIDLILLDYLNILRPIGGNKRSSDRSWENQAEAVWDVKGLCADLSVSLWTAGQLKDEALHKKVLAPDDVKYARAIFEAAPVVCGLIQTVDDFIGDVLKFQVMKMRNAKKQEQLIVLNSRRDFMILHEAQMGLKDLMQGDGDD